VVEREWLSVCVCGGGRCVCVCVCCVCMLCVCVRAHVRACVNGSVHVLVCVCVTFLTGGWAAKWVEFDTTAYPLFRLKLCSEACAHIHYNIHNSMAIKTVNMTAQIRIVKRV
jgi:hypothetical protein